jgi:hypothetical protein
LPGREPDRWPLIRRAADDALDHVGEEGVLVLLWRRQVDMVGDGLGAVPLVEVAGLYFRLKSLVGHGEILAADGWK